MTLYPHCRIPPFAHPFTLHQDCCIIAVPIDYQRTLFLNGSNPQMSTPPLPPSQSTSTVKPPGQTLWRHVDFMKLWFGQTVSEFGSQVTGLAFSLTAVTWLHATARQMGVLEALQTLPFLLIGLFAGVFVDRVRRRPLLVGADIGRCLLLAAIPLLALMHGLTMWWLAGVAFGVGCLTVLFDIAYQGYLPSIVARADLVEGNGKMEGTRAMSGMAGPAIAGLLVQWLTAPVALLVDAGSYVVSVLSLLSIRRVEPSPAPAPEQRMWKQIGEGLTYVWRHPFLRTVIVSTAFSNFFSGVTSAVAVLFAVRDLGFTASLLGVVYALNAVGSAVGALAAARMGKRLGIGWAIVTAQMLAMLGSFILPFAVRPLPFAFACFVVSGMLTSFGAVAYNVNQVSVRQAITPPQMLGRMTASIRFIIWGIMPFGALAGGLLGSHIGLRLTLVTSAAGSIIPVVWLLFSPLRPLKQVDVA